MPACLLVAEVYLPDVSIPEVQDVKKARDGVSAFAMPGVFLPVNRSGYVFAPRCAKPQLAPLQSWPGAEVHGMGFRWFRGPPPFPHS